MALHSSRFAPRSLTLRLRARRACTSRAQRWWVAGGPSHYALVWLCALVFVLSFCDATSAQSSRLTPEIAFGDAIYGPGRNGDPIASICGRLNQISRGTRSTGTQDLIDRCNDLAPTQQNEVLRQIAPEEVGTQGMNAIETSTKTIGARLAALRRGASGISIQGLGLNLKEPALPGTLVAALGPFAAASSTTPTTTTTTPPPSPFSKLGLFVNGLFSVGEKDPTTNEAGFDFHTYGVIAGVDYRFTPRLVLGAAFTYQSTNNDLDNTITLVRNVPTSVSGGSADTRSYGFLLYGTYYVLEQFYVDGMLGFGWNNYRLDRVISYALGGATPLVNQIAHAEPDGHQFTFSVGAGYDFRQGALTFGPLVRLQYLKLNIDGYQEKINNPLPGFGWALALDSQDVESLTTALGGRVSYALSTGLGVLVPQVRIEWEHEFKNDARLLTARFVNDPQRQPIRFTTDNPTRNYVNLGAALSATFPGGISAFIDYQTVVALENVTRHDITVGMRGEF